MIWPAADLPFVQDIRPALDRAVEGLRAQVDLAVIGLSGGADSTLCACLGVRALGASRVYGLSMPFNPLDRATFNARSGRLAAKLGIHHAVLPIGAPVEHALAGFQEHAAGFFPGPVPVSALNQGNLRSRMRMVQLYLAAMAIGEAHPGRRVRVIGTGNLSEDYIGYDTKWGDGACDVFPIADFFKREVYMALELFRGQGLITEDLIDRHPSAGLWDGQTDEDELGFSYDDMAPAIHYLRAGALPAGLTPEQLRVAAFVRARHEANRHKLRPAGIRTITRT